MANDVLATIDPCITSSLSSTRAATVELLSMIVDFNAQLFRDYLLKQFRTIPESRNVSGFCLRYFFICTTLGRFAN